VLFRSMDETAFDQVVNNLVKNAPANLSRQSRDLNRVLDALGKR